MRFKWPGPPTVYLDAVEVTVLYKAAPKALSFDWGTPEMLLHDCAPITTEPYRYGTTFEDEFSAAAIDTASWVAIPTAAVSISQAAGSVQFAAVDTAVTGDGNLYLAGNNRNIQDYNVFVRWTGLVNKAACYHIMYAVYSPLGGYHYEIRYHDQIIEVIRTINGVATTVATANVGWLTPPLWFIMGFPDGVAYFSYSTSTAMPPSTWTTMHSEASQMPLTPCYFANKLVKLGGAGMGGNAGIGYFSTRKGARSPWPVRYVLQTTGRRALCLWTWKTTGGALVDKRIRRVLASGRAHHFVLGHAEHVAPANMHQTQTQIRLLQPPVSQSGLRTVELRWVQRRQQLGAHHDFPTAPSTCA